MLKKKCYYNEALGVMLNKALKLTFNESFIVWVFQVRSAFKWFLLKYHETFFNTSRPR